MAAACELTWPGPLHRGYRCCAYKQLCGKGCHYALRNLARRLLSIVDWMYGATVWEDCLAAPLLDIMPDLKGSIPAASRSGVVREFRRRYGMPAMVASAMGCMWVQVPQ